MPKGDWRFYAAVGVTLAVLAALPFGLAIIDQSYSARERDNAAKARTAYAERQSECSGLAGLLATAECLIDEANANHEQKQSEADLRAQQSVASSTYGLLWIGIVGVIMSGVGLALLWENLRQVRHQMALDKSAADDQAVYLEEQIRIAARAAAAAEQTAVATREIGQDQSRAYIHVSNARIDYTTRVPGILGNPDTHLAYLRITFMNTGATPSTFLEYCVRADQEPFSVSDDFIPPKDLHYHTSVVVPPNQPTEITAMVEGDLATVIRAHKAKPVKKSAGLSGWGSLLDDWFTIRGFIVYEDVFGDRWFTAFGFKSMNPPEGQSTVMVPMTAPFPMYRLIRRKGREEEVEE